MGKSQQEKKRKQQQKDLGKRREMKNSNNKDKIQPFRVHVLLVELHLATEGSNQFFGGRVGYSLLDAGWNDDSGLLWSTTDTTSAHRGVCQSTTQTHKQTQRPIARERGSRKSVNSKCQEHTQTLNVKC